MQQDTTIRSRSELNRLLIISLSIMKPINKILVERQMGLMHKPFALQSQNPVKSEICHACITP